MFEKLINMSLKNRGIILFALLAVTALGIFEYKKLDVEAFPDISPVMVAVFTEADGMAPEEVEQFISYPIENSMNGLPNVTLVKSTSAFGMSVVYVYFTDNTDMYFARQLVSERLNAAMDDLPTLQQPPALGPISSGLGQVFLYYLTLEPGTNTEGLDELTYLRDLNEWVVKRQLQTVSGVTDILSAGGHVLQYQVKVDPFLLEQYELTIEDVATAIQSNNRNVGGQYLQLNSEEHLVRGIGLLKGLEDIRGIAIKSSNGTPITIDAVANVDYGKELRRGVVTLDGEGEIVTGIVMKLYKANSSEIIEDLYKKVEQVQTALPDGVKIVPYYEQADLVDRSTYTVKVALIQGIVLVLLVLFAFLGCIRASIIVALSMPFCALIAFIGMNLFGVSANLMSLGGIAIALGMLVDGSIVVTENIHRILGLAHGSKKDRIKLIGKATNEVGRPIAYAIIIVITVFLPVLSLQAVEGKMFRPLAFTVILALIGSIIFALVIAPVLASFLINEKPYKESLFFRSIKATYKFLLIRALRFRFALFAGVAALVVVAIVALQNLGTEFIPTLEEGTIVMTVTMAPSISLDEAQNTIQIISRETKKISGVDRVISRIGRPEAGSHPHPINYSEIQIALQPNADKPEIVNQLRNKFEDFPGIQINLSQPIQNEFDELLSGVKAQLAIKVYGEDLDTIRLKAEEIRNEIASIPGLVDLSVEQSMGQPQVKIIVNRKECARYGITTDRVLENIETAIGGQVVDTLYKNTRRYDIHLRYDERYRHTPDALRQTFICSSSGALIPLDTLATIEQGEGPLQINRENNQRRWTVQGNIENRALSDVLADIKNKIATIHMPKGLFVEYDGQFKQQQQAMKRLSIIVPIVIISIFVLLWIAFHCFRHALMVILNVPMALIGGVFGLILTHQYLSVPASIGFIALFGIAMQDSMVMLSDFIVLRKEGQSVRDAVINGSLIRFRPVIMTTLTTLLGLLPLMLSNSPGAEVQRPLAVTVIFGLATSTLLTLFVLPAIYLTVEKKRKLSSKDD